MLLQPSRKSSRKVSNFTLTILGTASALPFSDRNPSAQALSVHGRLFLCDCGEGTQRRMRQEHLGFVTIQAIFLTHIHGDHCFGLFGLLSTMGLYHRTAKLQIYAPENFAPVLKFYMSWFGQDLGFEVEHIPLKSKGPEEIYLDRAVRVTAFPLNHKIECYGFRFDEIIPPKSPRSVPVPGRAERKPRSYAYCSDTAPFPELAGWVKGVNILYHEATFPSEYEDKARQYFHSTSADAAKCALEAGAGRLLLGHYSSRINDFDSYLAQARAIFGESILVNDGDIFEIQ